jgi:hypothetical protein
MVEKCVNAKREVLIKEDMQINMAGVKTFGRKKEYGI